MSRKPPKTAYKKGESGNPNGRPAGKGFVKWRRDFLTELMEASYPKWKMLVDKQLDEALSGNNHANKLIFEHVLPKQSNNINDEEENVFDNLTEEENGKLYDYISTLIPKNEIITFVNTAKKVSSYVKEMKLNRNSFVD